MTNTRASGALFGIVFGMFSVGATGCAVGSKADLGGERTLTTTNQDSTSPPPNANGGGGGASGNESPVTPTTTGDFEIRCHAFYRDPTSYGLEDRALPGSQLCTAVVDRSTRYCTIPAGQTTCAIRVKRPTTLAATAADGPSALPASQARCGATEARASFLCAYGMRPCTPDNAVSAEVVYSWSCDSSHLVSLTIDDEEHAITVPHGSPVTVKWNASPEAGTCKLTSTSVPQEDDAGFYGDGSKGALTTTPLANITAPYIFRLTCTNALGAVATSTVTANVRAP